MDLLSLFSNSALLRRFMQYVALLPMIMRYVEHIEATQESDPGPEKRKVALEAVTTNVDELIRRQILPPDIREGLDKTAGELIDTTVQGYNQVGFFDTSKKRKAKAGATSQQAPAEHKK